MDKKYEKLLEKFNDLHLDVKEIKAEFEIIKTRFWDIEANQGKDCSGKFLTKERWEHWLDEVFNSKLLIIAEDVKWLKEKDVWYDDMIKWIIIKFITWLLALIWILLWLLWFKYSDIFLLKPFTPILYLFLQ